MADPNVTAVIPSSALTRVGMAAIAMIRTRTQRSIGANGRPFGAYSTKPFARPYDGITAKAHAMLGDQLRVFTTKGGALWAIITGGYAAFKRAAYGQDGGKVNLTVTGRMLGSLTVISTNAATGEVVIGFTQAEESEKAYYQNVDPGRFPFLGFSDKERQALAELAAESIQIKT